MAHVVRVLFCVLSQKRGLLHLNTFKERLRLVLREFFLVEERAPSRRDEFEEDLYHVSIASVKAAQLEEVEQTRFQKSASLCLIAATGAL